MIKQRDNGKWFASCPICTWKDEFVAEREAKTELNNHINIKHSEGRQTVPNQEQLIPPRDLPPQIPDAVKER